MRPPCLSNDIGGTGAVHEGSHRAETSYRMTLLNSRSQEAKDFKVVGLGQGGGLSATQGGEGRTANKAGGTLK